MRSAAVLLFLSVAAAARGQSPDGPITRADVAVSTGWFAADRSFEESCCSPLWSAGLFKGLSAGYYWTDHVKTEAAFASPGETDGSSFSYQQLANGVYRSNSDEHHYGGTKLSIAQIYQFGRNSTFHPFVSGGIDVDRERDTIDRYVASTIATTTHTSSVETSVHARAVAGAGFKAYFSERSFFKGEARFAGGRRFDQMTWTAGVGVDLGGRRPRSAAAATRSHAIPRAQEPVDVWRRYASQLTIGTIVDVRPAGSDGFTAAIVAVDADGVLLKPVTRQPEPARHVAFDQLEMLALHDGPRPGARVGATLAGVGAGTGTFMMLLVALAGFAR